MSILFDLDGTLVDTALDFILAINELRVEMDLAPLPQSALPLVRIAVSEGIESLVAIGFGYQMGSKQIAAKFGYEIGSKSIEASADSKANNERSNANPSRLQEALLNTYQKYLGYAAKPFPGIVPLLDTLEKRHIPWGIVTNKDSRFTEPLLANLKLNTRAACIVSGDTTPNPKPHPDPLFHACQQIGIPPKHCIYVGDAKRDILA